MLRRSFTAPIPPNSRTAVGWHRAPALLAAYLVACIVVMGGVAAAVLELRLDDYEARERDLLKALEQRELARHEVIAEAATLRRAIEAQGRQLEAATAENARLSQDLAMVDAERAALETERRIARERAQRLDRRVGETERWLATAEAERLAVEQGRTTLESRIADLRDRLGQAEDEAAVLRQHLVTADGRLARLERERELAQLWLADWISGRLEAIETVLQHTGIEPGRSMARAVYDEVTGQGGPFLPTEAAAAFDAGVAGPAAVWWPSGRAGGGIVPELGPDNLAPEPSLGEIEEFERLDDRAALAARSRARRRDWPARGGRALARGGTARRAIRQLSSDQPLRAAGRPDQPAPGDASRSRFRRASRQRGSGHLAGHRHSRWPCRKLWHHGRDRSRPRHRDALCASEPDPGGGRSNRRSASVDRCDRDHRTQHWAPPPLRGPGRRRAARPSPFSRGGPPAGRSPRQLIAAGRFHWFDYSRIIAFPA